MKRRPDGRWQKRKTIDGKSIVFYSTKETERQAIKDIEAQMLRYAEKEKRQKHNFKILGEKALDYQSKAIEYNTLQSYVYSFRYLEPLYDFDIEDISSLTVQKLIDDMVYEYGYSFSAVSKAKIVFGIIMNYAAVQEGLPIINFSKSIKIPRKARKGSLIAPPDMIRSVIIDNADKTDFGMWAMCLLCLGLRRGELAALQLKHIDFEKNEINIVQSVEFLVNQPNIKSTKTEESENSVPILSIIRPYLAKMCENLSPDDYLFGKDKPLTKTQIDKRLKKYCSEIGHTFTSHQLRHAYAKLLYEAGVDVKTMQRLLRHKNFTTTMNIYTEFSKNKLNDSVGKINDFISKL